jgi:hypothetical protein
MPDLYTLRNALSLTLALFPATLFAQTDAGPAAPQTPQITAAQPQDNYQRAPAEIARLEQELKFVNKTTDPLKWAKVQSELGRWCWFGPTGNRAADLNKSISACQNALTVLTPDNDRRLWIDTQFQLAESFKSLIRLDAAQQSRHVLSAIRVYEQMLGILTRDQDLDDWTNAQAALGTLWGIAPYSDVSQFKKNIRSAIAAYEAEFTGLSNSPQSHARRRAQTMAIVARYWMAMPSDNNNETSENIQKALNAWSIALAILPPGELTASLRAEYQTFLADCWRDMPANSPVDKRKNLITAAAFYEAILNADPKAQPQVATLEAALRLINIWEVMPAATPGEKALNARQQVTACQSALKMIDKSSQLTLWALFHANLALALNNLIDLPGQDNAKLLTQAIASEKAALPLITDKPQLSDLHNKLVQLMATHKKIYESTGLAREMPFDAIKPAE